MGDEQLMYNFIWKAGNGESMSLGSRPFLVQSIGGFGGSPVILQTMKAPFQDGQTLVDQLLDSRDISLTLTIFGADKQDVYEKRRKLSRLFNPKLGEGTLTWQREDANYSIKVVPDVSSPEFPGGDGVGTTYQKVLLYLKAPDPALFDPNEEHWTLASFVGGITFPFSFPVSFGTVGQTLTIENKGDINTPVFISFKGPLRNPVLENKTTGKKISITRELFAGETLEVNTAFGQKSVQIVNADGTRSNAFHYVSPDSEFWNLIPGDNEVSYAATEESGDSAVNLFFYHRYVGV
jgi:hypothetical protein